LPLEFIVLLFGVGKLKFQPAHGMGTGSAFRTGFVSGTNKRRRLHDGRAFSSDGNISWRQRGQIGNKNLTFLVKARLGISSPSDGSGEHLGDRSRPRVTERKSKKTSQKAVQYTRLCRRIGLHGVYKDCLEIDRKFED
jgi:hypothetical protein